MSNYAGIFYRIRQRLPDNCLKSIYFAFVYPHLLHGIEVYAITRPTHLFKLVILNIKILRMLQNMPYRSPVKDLYTAYNTLPIPQLHIQQLLLLVHKCIYHKYMLPQIFLDYFHDNYTIYCHDTRQKNQSSLCIAQTQLLAKDPLNFKVLHYGMSFLSLWSPLESSRRH